MSDGGFGGEHFNLFFKFRKMLSFDMYINSTSWNLNARVRLHTLEARSGNRKIIYHRAHVKDHANNEGNLHSPHLPFSSIPGYVSNT